MARADRGSVGLVPDDSEQGDQVFPGSVEIAVVKAVASRLDDQPAEITHRFPAKGGRGFG